MCSVAHPHSVYARISIFFFSYCSARQGDCDATFASPAGACPGVPVVPWPLIFCASPLNWDPGYTLGSLTLAKIEFDLLITLRWSSWTSSACLNGGIRWGTSPLYYVFSRYRTTIDARCLDAVQRRIRTAHVAPRSPAHSRLAQAQNKIPVQS